MFNFLILLVVFQKIYSTYYIYVSPTGTDDNNGFSEASSVRTVNRAIDLLRRRNLTLPSEVDAVVQFSSGYYELNETIYLDKEKYDSNVIWVAKPVCDDSKPVFHGSKDITNRVKRVTDSSLLDRLSEEGKKAKVFAVDISDIEIGEFGSNTPDISWLYSPNHRYKISQYPKGDYVRAEELISDAKPYQWKHNSDLVDEISRWMSGQQIDGMEDEIRIHMYPSHDWYDQHLALSSLTTNLFEIDQNENVAYSTAFKENPRYYLYNIFDSLSEPGDFYINKKTKTLYFIPFTDDNQWFISSLDSANNLLTMNGIENTHFEGISFHNHRKDCAYVRDTVDCSITKGEFFGCEQNGLNVGGKQSRRFLFKNNKVSYSGVGIYVISAGDRTNLVKSETLISHNQIVHISLWKETYHPCVTVSHSVDVLIEYNEMAFLPHSAITYGSSNYLTFSNNWLHHVALSCNDCGAIYAGRHWTSTVTISDNLIEDINNGEKNFVSAIYLDDMLSNIQVLRNVVINATYGLFLGGGRSNVIEGNKWYEIDKNAQNNDDRGLGWASYHCESTEPYQGNRLDYENMKETINTDVWKAMVPWLPTLLNDEQCAPKYNKFKDNSYCNVGGKAISSPDKITDHQGTIENTFEDCVDKTIVVNSTYSYKIKVHPDIDIDRGIFGIEYYVHPMCTDKTAEVVSAVFGILVGLFFFVMLGVIVAIVLFLTFSPKLNVLNYLDKENSNEMESSNQEEFLTKE